MEKHKKEFKDRYKKFYNEFQKYKGTFVINGSNKVERLIAIIEDFGEWPDFFWVTYNGREISYNWGGFVPLKGKIDKADYGRMVRIAKLNHADVVGENGEKDKTKIEIHKDKIVKRLDSDKLKHRTVTEICWKIN